MYANCSKSPLLKVVILGDMGVGKTCLMRRLVHDQFDFNPMHTIGVDFLTKEMALDGETFTLQIWDTAGQEKFRSLRTPFYRGSDLCMLTYSVVNRSTFDHLSYWKREFAAYARPAEMFPFIVVGTKLDLAEEMRSVRTDLGEKWCRENGIESFIETSSRTKDNVEQAFRMALSVWRQKNAKLDEFSNSYRKIDLSVSDLVKIRKNKTGKRKTCFC